MDSFKSKKVDKLDVFKLKLFPNDLKNLGYLVDKEVVKKDEYDKLVKKVNVIDTSRLVKKTDFHAKINEIKGEIPSISGLAATAALNVVDKKIPHVSF